MSTLSVRVIFNANGGSGAPSPVVGTPVPSSTFPKTLTVSLPSGTPTRSGYTFLVWSDSHGKVIIAGAISNSITIGYQFFYFGFRLYLSCKKKDFFFCQKKS